MVSGFVLDTSFLTRKTQKKNFRYRKTKQTKRMQTVCADGVKTSLPFMGDIAPIVKAVYDLEVCRFGFWFWLI
jgi:hypothetical protein